MKANAVAQMEDERERIGLLPALSQGRSEMKTCVARNEPVEEQLVDVF